MATTSALEKYFNQSLKQILAFFDRPDDRFSKKDFHDLRVNIKRIKALTALLEKLRKKFKQKSLLQPLQKLFDQAAKVRENEVQHDTIKTFPKTSITRKFSAELKDLAFVERKKFSKMLKPSLKAKLKKNAGKIIKEIRKADFSRMKNILLRRRKKIEMTLAKDKLNPREVHETRKRIKKIFYLQDIFQPGTKGFIASDDFQELLGKWHDGVILINGLKRFLKAHRWNAKELISLHALLRKVTTQNDKVFQQILRKKNSISPFLSR
jgi:CHAD domain-containing protein